jgi:tetratricopeptide (TPR) repeat protein
MLPTETNVDAARRLAPGTLVAGRYRIVALVGVGGMGEVYRAHDEELDLDVALKVLRSHLAGDPRFIERFRRELILARQVTHPNVVRIHDIGESDGMRFLTMDYVAGQSLFDLLEREGPLGVDRAVAIVRQLADGLQRAHDANIVHRDLKPGNVLVDTEGTAYLTDFGVARSIDVEGGTRAGAVVGTPAYLSPEQVTGSEVDHRADIYTLGLVFYEMLTGELPFAGDSQEEVLAQRLTGHAREVTRPGVAIPRYVRTAIARCLERQPSRRYQNAADLVADLDAHRTRVTTSRIRRVVLAAAAALVVLAGGAALYWGGVPWRSSAQQGAESPTSAARHAVAVLPLADETSDPSLAWTATGVAEMIASKLAETPELRVVDPQRVVRTIHDLGIDPGRYDDQVLRQLAELLDVDTLLAGNVRRAGTTMRVDLRLLTVGADRSLEAHAVGGEAPGEDGLFALTRDLSERLRNELGAVRATGADADADTDSVEAARAYAEGRKRLALGDYVGAAPALERAVAADPSFAAALERLSETFQNLGFRDKASAAAEQAARAVEGSRSRTAYRVRARLALLRGEPEKAEELHAQLSQRYPNDTEILLDLAGAQAARGEVARAVETLRKVASIDAQDPRAWFLLGKNTILMGESRRAVSDYLVRALALHTQLRNEQGRGEVLNAMGVAHHQLGEYVPALENYTASAEIRQRLGDERGTATSLKNRARILMAMGRGDEAEPDLRAAREIYEKIGDPAGTADVLNDFGVLSERRGAYARALEHYQAALKIRRGFGDRRLLAQSQDNIGYIYYVQGEYDSAAVFWKEALALREGIGEKGGVILSTQNLGFLQTAQGQWTDAMKSFLTALEKSREIDFRNATAVSYGNLGILQHYQGRYDAALGSLAEALAILNTLDDERGLAEFTIRKAAVHLDLGQLQEARTALDAAGSWVKTTGNREQQSDHLVLSAELALRTGALDHARRALARAVDEAEASHSRPAVLRARLARAAAPGVLAENAAATALQSVLREAEALGDPLLQIRAAEALARAHLSRRRFDQAERLARSAVSLAERCGWEAGLYRLHALLGAIHEGQGRPALAAAAYQESERRIQQLRNGLAPTMRASFDTLPAVREVSGYIGGRETAEPAAATRTTG